MWMRSENSWKRSRLFYFLPSLIYYQDSGFVEDKSLTLAWLWWSIEVGLTIDPSK